VFAPLQTGMQAIPGCRLLMEENRKMQQYISDHPEILQQQRLMKRSAWTFTVGSKGPIQSSGWWATNIEANNEYVVPSTCRAVGPNSYIFVEDVLWNDGTVNQAAVDSILSNWESRTPAFPNKGIHQVDIETFGNPMNVDNDNRIIILILDIIDGGSSNSYVAGYFFSINQFADGSTALQGRRSNFAEIYYLDGKQSNLKTTGGLTVGMQTTAHEFQHMIHYKYDTAEPSFINEACSQVAELVCGYPYNSQSQNLYTDNTDVYLMGWNGTLADYSRGSRWALYLWNQFPNNYLRSLVQDVNVGVSGINSALESYSPTTSRRFNDNVLIDWHVANYLQDQSVDSVYGYTYLPSLTKPKTVTYVNPNTGPQSATVIGLGADFISFTGGSDLSITFTGPINIRVKAVKEGAGAKAVEDVTVGAQYTPAGFGSTYSSVTFIIINIVDNPASNSTYNYEATGTGTTQAFEIKYDAGAAAGYFPQLSSGDRQLVYFTGIGGTKLDSIRAAFRRIGSIDATVTRFTQLQGGFSLSPTLISSFTVTSTDSTQVINNQYPVPYENWFGVDLRSHNVDAGSDFAVIFNITNAFAPGLMVSSEPDDGQYHSLTYIQADNLWYNYGDQNNPGNILKYLVRAYVSTGTTVNAPAIELLPTSFSLKQNYPNPFNPSTTIKYDLPERTHVKLHIYDMLGRVVATLIDQEQSAGSYETRWDGTNLSGLPMSSGVYFYRLESGNFREVKRMVLMK